MPAMRYTSSWPEWRTGRRPSVRQPRASRPGSPIPLAPGLALLLAIAACGADDDSGLTGPETGPPTQLAFVAQPGDAPLEEPMSSPIRVAIQDSAGNTVTDATDAVALTLESNPGGARLSGTTTVQATDGIATFDELVIDEIGTGYTLRASAAGLSGAVSEPFDVRFVLVRIETGTDHTCGLMPGGSAYCWGTNEFAQFGNGQTGPDQDVPVPAAGDLRFSGISPGDSHTCGLTPAGEAYCWGQQSHGERGDGKVGTSDTAAVPTPVIGGLTFVGLDAGEDHTCGLAQGGVAYCWGNNSSGQLGDGATRPRTRGSRRPSRAD